MRKAAWNAQGGPGRCFWGLVALGVLTLGASYGALVVLTASWGDTQQLNRIYPNEGMCIRHFGPVAWQQVRSWLASSALVGLVVWVGFGLGTSAGRTEGRALQAELRYWAQRVRHGWRNLSGGQRQMLVGQLALLTLVRLYLSWTLIWHDDAASYELFVRHGLLAVGAYYPVPNNHQLANVLAWGFYQLHPAFWWSMRLPVLLTSTAATTVLFATLARRLGYWPALLAAAGTSWLQPSLYYAANGRGYWLVLLLAGSVFWALLVVLEVAGRRSRVAWLVLVAAGGLGSYAVPSFVYVLVAAWSWLGLQALRSRQRHLRAPVVASGVLVGVLAGLLYAPTLFVSGLPALVANAYVRPLGAQEFWSALPSYVWFTEGFLGGQFHFGGLLGLLGVGAFGWTAWRTRTGLVAARLRWQVQQVGWPALWFAGLPYVLLLGQHVLPPERIWLYKAWFGFVVLALVLANWRWTRTRRWLLGLGVVCFAIYQLTALLRDNRRSWLRITRHQADYQWFAAHPRVLFPAGRVVNCACCDQPVADPSATALP